MLSKNKLILFSILAIFLNCKTNQKIDGYPHGIWITKFAIDSINNKYIFKSKEVYKKGIPIRTWKNYLDGKLTKKEKYKKDLTATVTYYYSNGKIEKKGKTRTEISKKEVHWFYQGPWKFYDTLGKPTHIIYYENGVSTKTDTIK